MAGGFDEAVINVDVNHSIACQIMLDNNFWAKFWNELLMSNITMDLTVLKSDVS